MNPPMTYSKFGVALTERFEGFRDTAYQDIAGVWTIGYGTTGPEVKSGMTVTPAQAEGMLIERLTFAAHCVNTGVDVCLTQSEFDALTDFVYNVGCAAFCGSTLRRLLNEGHYAGAAEQFDLWDHAGGKVVAGLLKRREAEAGEFNGPQ
jgi:lysozyme